MDVVTRSKRSGKQLFKLFVNPAYSNLADFVENLPLKWTDGEGEEIFHKRNVVRVYDCNGCRCVVKRFKSLSLFKSIIYTMFKPSKGRRAFNYSFVYNERGVATPEGIACIEVYKHALVRDVYFISKFSAGVNLFDNLALKEHYDSSIANEVGKLFADMHQKGVMHSDPNLANVMYGNIGGQSCFEVIDINRSKFAQSFSYKEIVNNLSRITHRRELLSTIVERYAEISGYDATSLVDDVFVALTRFEKRRELKYKLKHILKRWSQK